MIIRISVHFFSDSIFESSIYNDEEQKQLYDGVCCILSQASERNDILGNIFKLRRTLGKGILKKKKYTVLIWIGLIPYILSRTVREVVSNYASVLSQNTLAVEFWPLWTVNTISHKILNHRNYDHLQVKISKI